MTVDWRDFVVESALFGLNSLIVYAIGGGYARVNATIDRVQNAHQVISSNDLEEVILDGGHRYSCLRGQVIPAHQGQTLSSQYAAEVKGVVQEVSVVEHKKRFSPTGFWVNSSRTLSSFCNEKPFGLSLSGSPNAVVDVDEWHEAERIHLDVTHDKFDKAPFSAGSQFVGWISGDIPTGVQTTEKMIRVGAALTAVGDVAKSADGRIRITPEFLVQGTQQSLIKELKGDARVYKWLLFLFGGIGVGIAVFAGWKLFKTYERMMHEREEIRVLEEIREERPDNVMHHHEDDDRGLPPCCVCLNQRREIVLLECGHVCLCADCAERLMRHDRERRCPICRRPVERFLGAYLS